MTEVFQKAADEIEREVRLLEPASVVSTGSESLEPGLLRLPDISKDLQEANANFNPIYVVPGSRAPRLKGVLLRFLRLPFHAQIAFNAAVVRILNVWSRKLAEIFSNLAEAIEETQNRWSHRFAELEQRRHLWESRMRGDQEALDRRMSALEVDAAAAFDRSLGLELDADRREEAFAELRAEIGRIEKTIAAQVVEEQVSALRSDIVRVEAETRIHLEDRAAKLSSENLEYVESIRATLVELQESVDRARKARTSPETELFSASSYFEFENQNRGTRDDILARQRVYLPILADTAQRLGKNAKFVDLGCGRGELLELAYKAGIAMKGYDSDASMVAHCRSLGLKAKRADLFEALDSFADASLAGVTAIQVIEHLSPEAIIRLIHLAQQKLAAGGCIIFETINPHSVYAMRDFYLDPTHVRPVPAATAKFLLQSQGFVDVETRMLSPVEFEPALEAMRHDKRLAPLADVIFGFQDYAVIGMRA
jgi:SAM-dependent methyltransferase